MPISDQRLYEISSLLTQFKNASYRNTTEICDYDPEDYGIELTDEDVADAIGCNTILINGISNSSSEFVLRFLKLPFTTHLDVKSKGYNQCTPLILCMSKGWNHTDTHGYSKIPLSEIAFALMEKGADVNLIDKKGRSALHYACLHRNIEAIQFLIAKGAQWDIQDNDGLRPLDFLFYDVERASDILENASGGRAFTLEKKFFSPDFNLSPLISALVPANEIKSSIDIDGFFSRAQKNKEITDKLNGMVNQLVILAKQQKIDLTDIYDFEEQYSKYAQDRKAFMIIYLYDICHKLMNTASKIIINPEQEKIELQKRKEIIQQAQIALSQDKEALNELCEPLAQMIFPPLTSTKQTALIVEKPVDIPQESINKETVEKKHRFFNRDKALKKLTSLAHFVGIVAKK